MAREAGDWPVKDLVVSGGQFPELFFVAPHARGEGVECGAEGGDFVGEGGEGAAGSGAVTVLLDDTPEQGVPVESWCGPGRYGRQRR